MPHDPIIRPNRLTPIAQVARTVAAHCIPQAQRRAWSVATFVGAGGPLLSLQRRGGWTTSQTGSRP